MSIRLFSHSSNTFSFASLTLLLCLGAPLRADEGTDFFEKKIRPVLTDACYSCHAQSAEKIKGGLSLDTKAGWERGGDSGPALIPGNPDGSLLIKAIRYSDENLQMPPKGKKLTLDQ